jgi:hypothetical protein
MELYQIYLQLPGNIRIVIDILLLVLALLWFYLPFAVIGTNRRLAKLLESNKNVEDNTQRMAITLNKLTLDLDDSQPGDEGFYQDEALRRLIMRRTERTGSFRWKGRTVLRAL